jgi:hypothetical protein
VSASGTVHGIACIQTQILASFMGKLHLWKCSLSVHLYILSPASTRGHHNSAQYGAFAIIKICIIDQILVILMTRIMSLDEFVPSNLKPQTCAHIGHTSRRPLEHFSKLLFCFSTPFYIIIYTASCIIQIVLWEKFASICRIYWINLDFLFKIKVWIFWGKLNIPQNSTEKTETQICNARRAGAPAGCPGLISY